MKAKAISIIILGMILLSWVITLSLNINSLSDETLLINILCIFALGIVVKLLNYDGPAAS